VTADQKSRDWDKELAQIDKLIASGAGGAKNPPAAAPSAAPAPAARGGAAPAAAAPRRHLVVFTWVRLLLGLAIGVGITQWPYARGCGVLLFGYLGAVGGVIVAGLWSGISSWRTRSGLAHVLSLLLVFWGAILGAREVLPRVGYARTRATWFCPANPPGPAQPGAPASTQPQGAF
jgi:hypothetical protein